MNVTLLRDLDDGRCALGVLRIRDVELQTLERPRIAPPLCGLQGRSCVPPGTYQLALHDTEAHPRSFALVNEALGVYHFNVPRGLEGRTACVIHIANYPEELRGCIALGLRRARNGASWCIPGGQSKPAVDRFYSLVPWVEGHTLTIKAAA